jgi:asparagine synthetase B (glutamine-hydrolysing)
MSRKIKSLGVKMVLSGEGSDEIFGGYLYFHKAPNKEELHQETCRKVIYHNCYAYPPYFDLIMMHIFISTLLYVLLPVHSSFWWL